MKKGKYIMLSIVALSFITYLFASSVKSGIFYRGTFLKTEEVKKKWGDKKTDVELWKKGMAEQRAGMAYDIMINKKLYIGKKNVEIKNIFGKWDSYYINDSVPSYVIQESKSEKEECWELVFKIDQDGRVFDIAVHRNYP
jgi:hypothetical protein